MLALLRRVVARLYGFAKSRDRDIEGLGQLGYRPDSRGLNLTLAQAEDGSRTGPSLLGQRVNGLAVGIDEIVEGFGLLGHGGECIQQTSERIQQQPLDYLPITSDSSRNESKATPAPNANQIAGIADHTPERSQSMTTLQPAAPAANLIFPVDLMSEVPNFAYIEGLRAVWHAPEIAEALDPTMGVVAVTDLRGVVVEDEHVRTLEDARRWLTKSVDWHELVAEEGGE